MNALRHGLAALPEDGSPLCESELDPQTLFDRLMRIQAERARLTGEIESRLQSGEGGCLDDHLDRLAALQRYERRSSSALRSK